MYRLLAACLLLEALAGATWAGTYYVAVDGNQVAGMFQWMQWSVVRSLVKRRTWKSLLG
jgi:hypothetical protein